MQNKSGFIPKSLMQPTHYNNYFGFYAAIYYGEDNKQYHIQLEGNLALSNEVTKISILRQDDDGRAPITFKEFKTIKSAVNHLENYFIKKGMKCVIKK